MRRMGFALTILMLLLRTMAVAQTIGGRLGVTRSTQSGAHGMTGFTVGGYIGFTPHRYFGIQPEVLYSQKGSARLFRRFEDGGRVFVESQLKVKLGYIDVPVLAMLRVPLSAGPVIHFAAGPSASFLVRCTRYIRTLRTDLLTGQLVRAPEEALDCGELKNTDVAFSLAAGIGLAISRAIVAIDVRYSIGLVDIDPGAPDTRNRVLAMTIGVGSR